MSTLSDLARKIYGERVVHVPGEPGAFAHLLSVEDFQRRLRHHAHAFKNGQELRFLNIETAFEQEATVYFKNVAGKLPMIGQIVDAVKEVSKATSVQASIVCSQSAARGYELHQDFADLIVLQISGQKHWTIYADCEQEIIAWEGLLNDGDMLFVPKNWWHVADPQGSTTHVTLSLFL